jgi:hypothetical protein
MERKLRFRAAATRAGRKESKRIYEFSVMSHRLEENNA